MNIADAVERPAKKRRFFVEDAAHRVSPPASESTSTNDFSASATEYEAQQSVILTNAATTPQNVFDVNLLTAVVGEQLPNSTLQRLQEVSKGDLETGNVL